MEKYSQRQKEIWIKLFSSFIHKTSHLYQKQEEFTWWLDVEVIVFSFWMSFFCLYKLLFSTGLFISSVKFFNISCKPSGILPLSISWHLKNQWLWSSKYVTEIACRLTYHFWYNISSSLSLMLAFSRSSRRSSKYWYLNFFRALHSLADCLDLSSFDWKITWNRY